MTRPPPAAPQEAPPEETAPDGADPEAPPLPAARAAQVAGDWHPVTRAQRVRPAGDPVAVSGQRAPLPGGVHRPDAHRAGSAGGSTSRASGARPRCILNGRRLGRNTDPYTPFGFDARGLRPGRTNQLVVVVDSRKDPDLPEGWWNWGGIVRPVHLRGRGPGPPAGPGNDVAGALPRPGAPLPRRAAAGRNARAAGAPRGEPHAGGAAAPAAAAATITRSFRLGKLDSARRRVRADDAGAAPGAVVPGPPAALRARASPCATAATVQQVIRRRIGLRSVTVKRGHLYLNNRRVALRGASITRGHAGPRRRAHRLGHGHDRERAQGPRRERDPRALPHERPPALALRPGRDPGVERGADLAARQQEAHPLAPEGAPPARWSRWSAR